MKPPVKADLANDFLQALLALNRIAAQNMLADQLQQMEPITFVEDVVVAALERIGEEWQNGNVALSQVYMGGKICEELVDSILPPDAPERKDQPKMAICVLSDHHILGKNIVYSLLRASGFELQDFGTTEVDVLVERVEKEKVKILLISVLMLPSALKIRTVTNRLIEKELNVKVVVGGAPFRFDKQLYKEVGADAMCETASDAVVLIEKMMGGNK